MAEQTKRDYYEVLGVARTATKDDLRTAYRKLARKYHPDVSKEAQAEARFKEINEAYQVLSDEEKRSAYDRFGHAGLGQMGAEGGFGGFGFGGFEDIFGDILGFGRRSSRPGPRRGDDLRYDLEIRFEEAVFGCEKELQVARMETCPECMGSGAEPGTTPIRCVQCGGTGQVRQAQQSIFGAFVNVSTCPRCRGTGEVITTPCKACRGAGRVQQARSLMVNIPAGVDDDMRVRLPGEGEPGEHGGPPGNLYVVVHVTPHAYFQRREDDILLNLNINIAQAALGDEISVPTLNGEHKLTLPAGTQPGAAFRLR
ncbi:MAG: molecular chaperone DnaJ, partial [Chloroflexota bacterium]